jgi:hypothetical protein
MKSDAIVAGLPINDFVALRIYIENGVEGSGHPMSSVEVASRLMEFEDIFPGGVVSMLKFVNESHKDGQREPWIISNITHDLYGVHERFMSPRTGGRL